ncbi:zinc finger and BTB domain-containing protein 17 [Hyalella azteca]|uniref:Zinc finger and BTB domain-containing protein 17 n=1 Tax=Hyalella azteca TaxID=294128 RepID=A0A8B7N4C2_HYAAZ|nr:zinc finger and BTB domain-containing protein 17 [Hyalella azteca]
MFRCLLTIIREFKSTDITAEFCRAEGISYSAALACREQLEAMEELKLAKTSAGQVGTRILCQEMEHQDGYLMSRQPFYLRLHDASSAAPLVIKSDFSSDELSSSMEVDAEHLIPDCIIKDEPPSPQPSKPDPGKPLESPAREEEISPKNNSEEAGMLSDLEDDFLDNILDLKEPSPPNYEEKVKLEKWGNDPAGNGSNHEKWGNYSAGNGSKHENWGNDSAGNGSKHEKWGNYSAGNGSKLENWVNDPAGKKADIKRVIGFGGNRREYCDFCNFSTMNADILTRHIELKHKGQERSHLFCQLCDYWTVYRTDFNKHLTEDHMNPNGLFFCPKCSYTSDCKANLYRHFNTHNKKYVYKCPLCSFVCSGNLGRHVRSQHGVELLKCPKCHFATWSKIKLEDHINSHLGRNKMVCTLCNWSTFFRQSYAKHMHHYHNNPATAGGDFPGMDAEQQRDIVEIIQS